jgi:hypothetical protein
MKINKTNVDNLPLPKVIQEGKTVQKRYYDDNLKGFGIRITSGGSKAFFVEKFINRKRCRVTLGHYPELTAEMARNKALLMLGQIAMGGDPVAEKKASTIANVTLDEVFKDYLKTRKTLKEKTISNYQQILDKGFTNWKNKPLLSITKDRVSKYHEKLGKEHGECFDLFDLPQPYSFRFI